MSPCPFTMGPSRLARWQLPNQPVGEGEQGRLQELPTALCVPSS